VEKPLTPSHGETARLLDLASERSLVLMENMMFVHHRQHAAVRRLVADGAIGELRALSAVFAVPPRPAGDIRLRADLAGGALLDQGVYPLRTAVHHLGAELDVVGAVLRYDPVAGVDVAGQALVLAPDGVTGHVRFGMDGTYRAAYELIGTIGRITVTRPFTPPPDHVAEILVDRNGEQERLELAPDDQFANIVAAFCRMVHDCPSGTSAAPTLAQARLVDGVSAAARRVETNSLIDSTM